MKLLETWSSNSLQSRINTPRLKTSHVLKTHGFVPRGMWFPRWFQFGLEKNKDSNLDAGGVSGCDLFYLGSLSDDLCVVLTSMIEIKWAIKVARRFEAISSLAMASAKVSIDSLGVVEYMKWSRETCSAKDLFNTCKQYGHVVDAFIPSNRSKSGKRFGLLMSLTWRDWPTGVGKTYMHAVKGISHHGSRENKVPALVLDYDCLLSKDLSKCLLGRVKEFASLANLKMTLNNEGFMDIKIQYMGEMWVILEFGTEKSMKLFRDNVSVGSWFSQINQASMDFVTEERIAWVELEDIPSKVWSGNTFKRIGEKWGVLLDIDDQAETCFHSKRLCIHTKSHRSISEEFKIIFRGKVFWIRAKETPGWVLDFLEDAKDEDQSDVDSKDGRSKVYESGSCKESDGEESPETLFDEDGLMKNQSEKENMDKHDDMSEDPFHIYSLLKKKDKVVSNKDSKFSMKYPPGFTPNEDSDGASMHVEEGRGEGGTESVCSGHFNKSEVPRTGGFILSLLDDVVKVGQVMGYKMDGCMSNMAEIIESQGVDETCWGNMAFDYVHSDSVGNSGGILCVWDPNAFCKRSVTMSDYFIMVRGVWRQIGKDFLIIVVYAHHDIKKKMMLWDYLTREIGRWKGEVVVIGDFNEVSLGGCSFTWCHKSATKMSKLDRFLVSESLLNTCPNISAITLERYLSDHRPILRRGYHFDYGPTPFRFFHYWFEMEGFSKIMEDAWKESLSDESNAMIRMMGNGNGNEEIAIKRMELVKNLQHIDKLNSLEIAQKAKVKWAIEGDENSGFFNGMLNKKRNTLSIRGIMVNGIWIDDPNLVKHEFLMHFSSRFSKPDIRRALIQMRFPKRLSLEQQVELESEVSNKEIKRAMWDCGTDKAPGPDGLTFGFYRYFWYLIDNDVYNVVNYFFMHGEIPKGCNSSFIALIPKILDANLVKDFRPISLIGSLYKIIAKILANRLVGVLGDIVNEVQSTLIADRQILDGPFILDELIQWCKRKKKQFLVFKVDFEKAYDSVRSSRGSIILNGSPTEEFQFYKGLKQGDPLSPFLFILIMESLHLSFQRVEDAGMFKGIKLGSSVSISHMFYTDDAVFVGQCDKVKGAAIKLGCLTFKTPFTYLGSTVGGSMSRIQAWEKVVERVKSRLSKWKRKTLSIGGRLTLLKSVLGSMSIFHMSIFKVPLGVLRKLESIRSHFFNGHDPNCNKASWIWRFYTQDTSLWVRVIKAIYGEACNIDVKVKAGSTSCWMSIVHEAKSLVSKGIDFFKFMRFKLGNGENARFWEDRWIKGDTLKKCFPRVYALELCKEITVAMKVTQPCLAFSFRRSPRGGVEQEQFEELVTLVHDVRLVPMSDRWTWTIANSGEIYVASVRQLIDDKTLPEVDSKTRWIKYVPIKVNVLAWKVKSDSLPTRFNVSRRGIPIDSIKCGICNTRAETSSHLFFSCCMVLQTVRLISRWWDISYAEFESYEDWLAWLVNLRLPSKNKLMLEGVFYVMWWLHFVSILKSLMTYRLPCLRKSFTKMEMNWNLQVTRIMRAVVDNPYYVVGVNRNMVADNSRSSLISWKDIDMEGFVSIGDPGFFSSSTLTLPESHI
uniref:RNA-directed DNA polymerase, eukaryota n=1 Tax=Tanacetum cinerariifolium TaxID=118510 RepID=A0A699H1X1_TANCI|nr:RNA-directed DNA polymerase, eukaryota [Tanacetum cinerariifolium]